MRKNLAFNSHFAPPSGYFYSPNGNLLPLLSVEFNAFQIEFPTGAQNVEHPEKNPS
jgi:hypothetical protein